MFQHEYINCWSYILTLLSLGFFDPRKSGGGGGGFLCPRSISPDPLMSYARNLDSVSIDQYACLEFNFEKFQVDFY